MGILIGINDDEKLLAASLIIFIESAGKKMSCLVANIHNSFLLIKFLYVIGISFFNRKIQVCEITLLILP